jgi:Cellulase (glycosyl hydrolase family 5)
MAEMPKIVVLTDDELTALIDSSVTKAIAPLSAAIAKINAGTPATTPGQQTGGETGGNGTQSPVDTGSAPGQPSGQETTALSLVPNAQVTGGDWDNGVWVADDTARISVASDPALKIGIVGVAGDGVARKVKNVEVFGDKTSVTFEGNKLDPSKVAGKAAVFTVPKSEGAQTPAVEPANDSGDNQTRKVGKIYVNLGMGAGADQVMPGIYDTNYTFFKEAEAKRAKDYGFDEVRVGFLMGRAIEKPGKLRSGAKDTPAMMLEKGRLCKKLGLTIMWDNHVHGFFPSNGASNKAQIGTAGYPIDQFASDWYTLITHLKSDPDTWAATTRFDLCNEPISIDDATWAKACQAVIDKCAPISEDKIFVIEGIRYSSTKDWVANNKSLHTITHPRGKQYIEFSGHLYLDAGADGYYEGDTINAAEGVTFETVGTKRIEGFANWLKTHGFNGNIGENLVTGSLTNLMKGERALLKYCVENGINVYLFGMGDAFGTGNAHNIELSKANSGIDNTAMLALAKEMAAYAKTLKG